MKQFSQAIFILLAIVSVIISFYGITPAYALLAGIIFALTLKPQFVKQTKFASKYLLQASVVGLGFGMNVHAALQSSSEGMLFTICSVILVMFGGVLLGKLMHLDSKLAYLISSGTAICGGSAIAAVSPVIKADSNQISVSLAVIFTLNAIALFIFPHIGLWIGLDATQFGTWAAIAIHDTSSVVGAGAAYDGLLGAASESGVSALEVATTVKLTRALWIIPLSLVSTFVFRSNDKTKISIPWFIFLFILAMLFNTYFPLNETLSVIVKEISHAMLSLTLFLIGSTLSVSAIKAVGYKAILMGIFLWIFIGLLSLGVILWL